MWVTVTLMLHPIIKLFECLQLLLVIGYVWIGF